MERMTHRRSDGSAYSNLDMQTCLNRLADYEDLEEFEQAGMIGNIPSHGAEILKEDKDARTD